ncbi:TadE/TadG family type IV pilus assembly protein [Sulfitobacter sediminilitoris]|uniref:TadE/TadG family type IV pilus assembly protein n=1 Tax=Sulfitobacter sediminilitoris TaxID=2698830 RepID=UPI00361A191E
MVDRGSLQAFFDEEDGVTLVEALLVTPIVILAITVMVELGVAMFQWNQSVKAIQIGARAASVSEPLMTWETYEAAMMSDWSGTNEGDPTPVAAVTISCGAGSSPCDSDGMDRLLTGGDGACGEGVFLLGCATSPPGSGLKMFWSLILAVALDMWADPAVR